jgi:hypothetical protein
MLCCAAQAEEFLQDAAEGEPEPTATAQAEESGKYPARPDRAFFVADLFGYAAWYDMAYKLEEGACWTAA